MLSSQNSLARKGAHIPEVCRMNLRKSVKKQSIFWQVLVSWQRSMDAADRVDAVDALAVLAVSIFQH